LGGLDCDSMRSKANRVKTNRGLVWIKWESTADLLPSPHLLLLLCCFASNASRGRQPRHDGSGRRRNRNLQLIADRLPPPAGRPLELPLQQAQLGPHAGRVALRPAHALWGEGGSQ
jgi:hypothetical protein